MNIYIQKDIPQIYIETEYIDENLCGYSYEDFLNGKYIKLEEDQVDYHKDYPLANVETVINVAIYKNGEVTWHVAPVEITLELTKQIKAAELADYDNSSAINDFTVNNTVHGWYTPGQRSNARNSIDSAKLVGIDTVYAPVGDYVFELNINDAELYLAQIQVYADRCAAVTLNHKNNINNLNTIEEVENYDFTTGYPQKLNFNV